METPAQSSNARLAAILALIAAFVVVMALVAVSLSGGGSEDQSVQGGRQGASRESQQSQRKIYVVKPGDCCLSQIANKTGVDVDALVRLNPNLDPQAIHSGDRVKLR